MLHCVKRVQCGRSYIVLRVPCVILHCEEMPREGPLWFYIMLIGFSKRLNIITAENVAPLRVRHN